MLASRVASGSRPAGCGRWDVRLNNRESECWRGLAASERGAAACRRFAYRCAVGVSDKPHRGLGNFFHTMY